MRAAERITAEAVPRALHVPLEQTIAGGDFHSGSGSSASQGLSFYQEAEVTHSYAAKTKGTYRLALDLEVRGQFEFDPGKCAVVFKADDHELWQKEFTWQNGKKFRVS